MIDYTKSARNPFNFHARNEPSKEVPAQEESKTDKDNADKRYDPPNKDQKPAPNLAPSGMSGNRGSSGKKSTPSEKVTFEFIPEGFEDEPEIDLTNDGTLVDGTSENGIEFLVKSEFPSEAENTNGQISRLTLIEDGQPTVHFDNGWVMEPQTEEQRELINKLETQFGDLQSKEFPSYSDLNPNPDNDIDH